MAEKPAHQKHAEWIAPSNKDAETTKLEKNLWDVADQFRANSGLKTQEYSSPLLGLIFLRFAEARFKVQREKLLAQGGSARRGNRADDTDAYIAEGILFLPLEAQYEYLLTLPEAADIGEKVNAAMRAIEQHNAKLSGVLPKTYNIFTGTLLKELLKKISEIPADKKWYRDLVISQVIVDTLKELNMQFPKPASGLDSIVIPD
jgi:type I restriction enzyme M protein